MADPVDADSIARAAAEPARASADGQSADAHPIPDQIAAVKFQQTQAATGGTNAAGGPKSGWRGLRAGRVIPPGGA